MYLLLHYKMSVFYKYLYVWTHLKNSLYLLMEYNKGLSAESSS